MSRSKSTNDKGQSLNLKTGVTDVIVIGAGHAGLAASYDLQQRSIDHRVLERGEIANSWKHERWDSLKLLTPNWQSKLPGFSYAGDDPDGFMTMPNVIRFVEDYADAINPPLTTGAEVTSVVSDGTGYIVASSVGSWRCKAVVIASGACNIPNLPVAAAQLPSNINSLTPHHYRNPQQLEPGGVLIVGASATGLQLADEIRQAGHEVIVATGEHVRMPRTYRGKDIQFWLHKTGILDERYDMIDDVNRARNLPSPQLVGALDPGILDLNRLSAAGAKIVGRLMGFRDSKALFSGSLKNVCALADLKMNRMLDTIDEWVQQESQLVASLPEPERFPATGVDDAPSLSIDLIDRNVRTVIWCTGFRPNYNWLNVDVFDHKGRIRHNGGIIEEPGLYVVGLPVLRRRKSSFIHGAEDDVADIGEHLAHYLGLRTT